MIAQFPPVNSGGLIEAVDESIDAAYLLVLRFRR